MRYLWVLILLAGCVTTHDLQGRSYPEKCRGDLSWVNAVIEYRPLEKMPLARGYAGQRNAGAVYAYTSPPRILIANETSPEVQDDILRHERCHVIAGEWHSYPETSQR